MFKPWLYTICSYSIRVGPIINDLCLVAREGVCYMYKFNLSGVYWSL